MMRKQTLSKQLEHIYQTVMSSGISAIGAHEFNEAIVDAKTLEQQVEGLEELLGDGGDLEYAADLLQTATNDHGVDQSFDNKPYFISDYLRRLSALASQEERANSPSSINP